MGVLIRHIRWKMWGSQFLETNLRILSILFLRVSRLCWKFYYFTETYLSSSLITFISCQAIRRREYFLMRYSKHIWKLKVDWSKLIFNLNLKNAWFSEEKLETKLLFSLAFIAYNKFNFVRCYVIWNWFYPWSQKLKNWLILFSLFP